MTPKVKFRTLFIMLSCLVGLLACTGVVQWKRQGYRQYANTPVGEKLNELEKRIERLESVKK